MIKVGIIGFGLRGKMFLDTVNQDPRAQGVAVADCLEKNLAIARERYRVKAFSDFREMIDTCELDAVIVATPDFLHRDPVVYAAEKKLSILVEKPFSTDEKECGEMLEAIERNGVRCMVAFENRWNLPILAVKNQIDSGALGDILTINARLNNRITSPTEGLAWSKSSSVGWFLFPHILDMILWYNGGKKVKQLYAVGVKKKLKSMGFDIYDSLQATLTFEDDTTATLSSCWVLPKSLAMGYDLKLEIVGFDSAAYVNTHDQCVRYLDDGGVSNLHTLSTAVDGFLTACPCFMTHHFIDLIHRNEQPEADARMGAYNTKIICAIHRSADEGGKLICL